MDISGYHWISVDIIRFPSKNKVRWDAHGLQGSCQFPAWIQPQWGQLGGLWRQSTDIVYDQVWFWFGLRYPLVNTQKTMENKTHYKWQFSIATLNYQRVHISWIKDIYRIDKYENACFCARLQAFFDFTVNSFTSDIWRCHGATRVTREGPESGGNLAVSEETFQETTIKWHGWYEYHMNIIYHDMYQRHSTSISQLVSGEDIFHHSACVLTVVSYCLPVEALKGVQEQAACPAVWKKINSQAEAAKSQDTFERELAAMQAGYHGAQGWAWFKHWGSPKFRFHAVS